MSDDPFALLGLDVDASAAEISAARRRLARSVHPDRGGDLGEMQALNDAYERALRTRAASPPTPPPPTSRPRSLRGRPRVQHDSPSFLIEALPSAAFEALELAAASLGETIVAAPPDTIECLLDQPIRCWCRLDVLPEGNASSVSLIVESYDDAPAPDIDDVRDAWVAQLNQL